MSASKEPNQNDSPQTPDLSNNHGSKLGEIVFCDALDNEESDAKAAIFSENSSAEEAIKVLKQWEIFEPKSRNAPELVITVTGGAGYFNMNSSVRDEFRQGLVEAAKKSDAVILTGGTFSGVMLHTGKALREKATKEIPTIGFTSFDVIKHNTGLEENFNERGDALEAYRYMYGKNNLKINKTNEKGLALDPNHTHHLIKKLDKSDKNQLGGHIGWWADVEKLIRNQLKCEGVLLCVQGGLGTLETCYNYLKNGTPLVVLKGTGRAADWIAKIIENVDELESRDKQVETLDGFSEMDDEVPDTQQSVTEISRKLIYKKWLSLETIDRIQDEHFWKTPEKQNQGLFFLGRILMFRKNVRIHSEKSLTDLSSIILEAVINKTVIKNESMKKISQQKPPEVDGPAENFLKFLVDYEKASEDSVDRTTTINSLLKFCEKIRPSTNDTAHYLANTITFDFSKMRDIYMCQEELKRRYELVDNLVSSVSEIIKLESEEPGSIQKKVEEEWDQYKDQKSDLDKMIKMDSEISRKLLLAVQYEQLDVFKSLMNDYQSFNGAIPNYVFLTVLRMIILRDLCDFIDPLVNSDNAIVKYSREFLLYLYQDRTYFVKEIKQEIMKVVFNNPARKAHRHVRYEGLTYNTLSKKMNAWYKNLYDKNLVSSVYFEGKSNYIQNIKVQNQADTSVEKPSEKPHNNAIDTILKALNSVKSHSDDIRIAPPKIHFSNGGSLVHLIDFCLLTGRFRTARVLVCEQSRMFGGGISTGVHAVLTCKTLNKKIRDNPSLTDRLERNSVIYEKYVCDLIQAACHTNHKFGKDLMLKQNPDFNENSIFEMAYQEELLELVTLPVWQGILDDAWFGAAVKHKIEPLPFYNKSLHGAFSNLLNKIIGYLLMLVFLGIDHIMALFVVIFISASVLVDNGGIKFGQFFRVIAVCLAVINVIWVVIPLLRAHHTILSKAKVNESKFQWRKKLRWYFDKKFDFEVKKHVMDKTTISPHDKAKNEGIFDLVASFYRYKRHMWNTPTVLFVQNIIGHVFLALLLVDMMLFRMCYSISGSEWYTFGMIVCLFTEELREFLKAGSSWHDRFAKHLSSFWNYIDLGGFVFFMAAFWRKKWVINNSAGTWNNDCDGFNVLAFDGNVTVSNQTFVHVPFYLTWLDGVNIWPGEWADNGISFKHQFDHWQTVVNCECPTALTNDFFPVLLCYNALNDVDLFKKGGREGESVFKKSIN